MPKGLKSQSSMACVWLSSSPDKSNALSNMLSTRASGKKCWTCQTWNVPLFQIYLFPHKTWVAFHSVSTCALFENNWDWWELLYSTDLHDLASSANIHKAHELHRRYVPSDNRGSGWELPSGVLVTLGFLGQRGYRFFLIRRNNNNNNNHIYHLLCPY